MTLSAWLDQSDPENPAFAVETKIAGAHLEDLVRSQRPLLGDIAQGRLNVDLAFDGRGLDLQTILAAVSGIGNLRIDEGVLVGINLADVVLGEASALPGLADLISPKMRDENPKLFSSDDTEFDAVSAGLEIKDGRVHTENFVMESKDFGIDGRGSFGLDGSVDFEGVLKTSPAMTSRLVRSAAPARALLDSTGRISIPLQVTGSVGALEVKPDKQFVMNMIAGTAVNAVSSLVEGLLGVGGLLAPEESEDAERNIQPPTEWRVC